MPLERLPVCRIVLAYKGNDYVAKRRQIEAAKPAPDIQPKINSRWMPCL